MSLQLLTLKLDGMSAGDSLTWCRDPDAPGLDSTLRSVRAGALNRSSQPSPKIGREMIPLNDGEPVLRAREQHSPRTRGDTITHARCLACQQVAGPHIHPEHMDAFYVFEGELTLEIGPEAKTITVGAGGFLAAPPRVAHVP